MRYLFLVAALVIALLWYGRGNNPSASSGVTPGSISGTWVSVEHYGVDAGETSVGVSVSVNGYVTSGPFNCTTPCTVSAYGNGTDDGITITCPVTTQGTLILTSDASGNTFQSTSTGQTTPNCGPLLAREGYLLSKSESGTYTISANGSGQFTNSANEHVADFQVSIDREHSTMIYWNSSKGKIGTAVRQ